MVLVCRLKRSFAFIRVGADLDDLAEGDFVARALGSAGAVVQRRVLQASPLARALASSATRTLVDGDVSPCEASAEPATEGSAYPTWSSAHRGVAAEISLLGLVSTSP